MAKIWVYAEQMGGRLDPVVGELLCKARSLADSSGGDAQVAALLLGHRVDALCGELADLGADVVFRADHESLALYNPMTYTPVIVEAVRAEQPDILLFGATALGSELGPTVAVPLETGVAAHCVDLRIDDQGLLVADVPSFGGKILGEILCPDARPQMASVKPGIFQAEACRPAPLCVENLEVRPPPAGLPLRAVSQQRIEPEGVPLDKAEIVFCGGYGLGGRENWEKLERLARAFGGAAGCTRPAVDEGWAPGEHVMVGTSGRSIRPKAYVGFGISGATHHVCGMKDAGLVISVNRDENAPIFAVSDVGAVADVDSILDALLERVG